jgi:hypothetical protein
VMLEFELPLVCHQARDLRAVVKVTQRDAMWHAGIEFTSTSDADRAAIPALRAASSSRERKETVDEDPFRLAVAPALAAATDCPAQRMPGRDRGDTRCARPDRDKPLPRTPPPAPEALPPRLSVQLPSLKVDLQLTRRAGGAWANLRARRCAIAAEYRPRGACASRCSSRREPRGAGARELLAMFADQTAAGWRRRPNLREHLERSTRLDDKQKRMLDRRVALSQTGAARALGPAPRSARGRSSPVVGRIAPERPSRRAPRPPRRECLKPCPSTARPRSRAASADGGRSGTGNPAFAV